MFINTTPHFGVIASALPKHSSQLVSSWAQISLATSVEIRLDGMVDKDRNLFVHGQLPSLFSAKPMILTFRPKEQGGAGFITPEYQWRFWNSLPDSVRLVIRDLRSPVFVDWAVDLVSYVCAKGYYKEMPFPWQKIGISNHRLEETPRDLQQEINILLSFPASAFVKFVCKANIEADVERIKDIYPAYRGDPPLIAFPMGPLGTRERFECVRRGSWGTYGFVPSLQPTANGQVPFRELLEDSEVREALKLRGHVLN